MSGDIILETEDLTKEFAGFVAVNGVTLRVARGTIHALIGPNGAGKTTCFNLLTKFLQPTRGRITFKGRDITALPPTDIARLGLVRSFQISAVFPHLTCRENIRIALQRQRGGSFDFWRSKRVLDELNDRAMALLADVGLADFANLTAVELPYGRKRALELATTLALDPEMLLLDEPTAGMGHEDIDRIAALIKSVGGEPHRADGRAQSQRRLERCPTASPCSRAAACWRKATTRPCRTIRKCAKPIWGSAMLDAPHRCWPSKACRPGTASRTSCTASRSTCAPARS